MQIITKSIFIYFVLMSKILVKEEVIRSSTNFSNNNEIICPLRRPLLPNRLNRRNEFLHFMLSCRYVGMKATQLMNLYMRNFIYIVFIVIQFDVCINISIYKRESIEEFQKSITFYPKESEFLII